MSEAAVLRFIATVELHFPRPKFSGDETMEAAWVKSMNRVLSRFDDDVLASAAERILGRRHPKDDGRFFPSPAECVEFCEEALDVKQRSATPLLSTAKRDPSPWAGWRTVLADDLMESATGKQAAREGWGLAFHTFCRENGRAPETPQEIARCKSSRRALDEGMAILRADTDIFARGPLIRIGQKMLAENDEMCTKAKGDAA
jgi:hypothetical protein